MLPNTLNQIEVTPTYKVPFHWLARRYTQGSFITGTGNAELRLKAKLYQDSKCEQGSWLPRGKTSWNPFFIIPAGR
mgnify:CR=1 FL=1